MGSKGSQTTTSQTSSAPDSNAYNAYLSLLQSAQGVASTPYQAYTGELVAPVNSQQQTGISGINSYANSAQPYVQQAASGIAANSQPITASQIAQYTNPYTQSVVNATQAQFNNQNQQQQQQLTGNAIAQGALGGNRTAVAASELANQQQLAQAPVIANLQSQGYTQGVNTALQEQQAGLQGAQAYGNMGIAGQNAGLTGAQAQVNAGTLQQQTQQAQDTAQLQQYQTAQAYPYQQLQWLAGIDTGVGSQMGGTTSGQTTSPAPNTLSSILGGLTSGVGLLGATGAYGSSGWLLPALAGLSDKHAKENIRKIGKAHNGMGLYLFNYKSDPTPRLGLVAQDVEKVKPEAVYEIGGLKHVDYEKALAKAHGGVVGYDNGGGVAGVPWAAGDSSPFSYIPQVSGIKGGPGAPHAQAPQASNVNSQQTQKDIASVGDLAKQLQNTISGPSWGGGSMIGGDAYGGSSSSPLPGLSASDYGAGFAKGGIAGFDDGGTPTYDPDSASTAISGIESGGSQNPYGLVGPATKSGDHAYGKYQVMGVNIPQWTEEATGQPATVDEFLNDPKLQDQVFQHKFGQYAQKYGPDGAARAWFAGEGNMNNPGAKDQLGTSVADYANRFDKSYGVTGPSQNGDSLAFSGDADGKPITDNTLPSEVSLGYSDHPTTYSDTIDQAPYKSSSGVNWGGDSKLWPSLISAGFGMMASRSPFLGVAIGEGGQAGMASYNTQSQREFEAQKLAQQLELERQKMMMPYNNMTMAQQKEIELKQAELARPFQVGQDFMGRPIYAVRQKDGSMAIIDSRTGKLSPMSMQGNTPTPSTNRIPATAPASGAIPAVTNSTNIPQNGVIKVADVTNDPSLPKYMQSSDEGRDNSVLDEAQQADARAPDLIKGVANYEINPASIPMRVRQRVLELAKAYDPSYDQTLYNAKQRAVNEFFAGGNTSPAGILLNGNTAILHLGEMFPYVDQMEKQAGEGGMFERGSNWLADTGTPFLSKWARAARNAGAQGTGTPFAQSLSAWNDLKTRFTDEVTRFYSGQGGGSEAEKERVLKAIDEAKSPAELKSAIRADIKAMRDKVEEVQGRLITGLNPGAWKAIARRDPSLVTTYKNARDVSDKLMAETQPNAAPSSTAPSPAPAQKTIARQGIVNSGPNKGKKVIEYSDGTREYQ